MGLSVVEFPFSSTSRHLFIKDAGSLQSFVIAGLDSRVSSGACRRLSSLSGWWSLETAAQSTEVVDCECTDKVNSGWSAESDTETFGYVHGGFTTVTLTECNLHSCH